MPVEGRRMSASVVDDRVYVIDGLTEKSLFGEGTVRIYDPESDSWEERKPMPFANRKMSCHYISSQERIYLLGGESPGDPPE